MHVGHFAEVIGNCLLGEFLGLQFKQIWFLVQLLELAGHAFQDSFFSILVFGRLNLLEVNLIDEFANIIELHESLTYLQQDTSLTQKGGHIHQIALVLNHRHMHTIRLLVHLDLVLMFFPNLINQNKLIGANHVRDTVNQSFVLTQLQLVDVFSQKFFVIMLCVH